MITKRLCCFLAVVLLLSCKNAKEEVTVISNQSDSITHSITPSGMDTVQSVAVEEDIDGTVSEGEFKNDFDILLPTRYRDWQNKNEADKLTEQWLQLSSNNGKYFLAKADYQIERGFDECSGDSTKTIQTKNKTLLLFENHDFKLGEIKTVKFSKDKIWPREKMTFRFNGVDYSFRAEGKVLSSENVSTDDGTEIHQNVKDYKLYISANGGAENLFLAQESFNDTFVQLLFIGDIDRDGKPDFIFGANRDYEEERVILFLSSKAEDGKLIRKVSEIAVQFDC